MHFHAALSEEIEFASSPTTPVINELLSTKTKHGSACYGSKYQSKPVTSTVYSE